MKNFFYWETEEPLPNNEATLTNFIENHLDEVLQGFEVIYKDGTYCIVNKGSKEYEIHASSNGDFTHHKVELIYLGVILV